ncbi:ribosomal protein uL16 3-hydroxylase [Streptomyces scabiei]|uniref:ribosomal protein uL16 3-hydroxylase n=1 Tax=Streptomyces scabiei TaxID=1930 RepID=UPI0029B6D4B6|nr:cupin domain-containing protein [Streptomyces scabiei]MDX2993364.1 cupin domain-containing protein [Streptomyces scabiei]MDX2993371.1 cupin domain-containing protein [Streptomyces scabiei]MDX3028486.1 cupin domain-containing protein [Streptomyces scabiei]
MTHTSIAVCLGEDFLAQALHREYRHVPGALDVAGLMSWDDLNQILAAHRLEPPRMRLSRDGETLLVGGYTTPVATRRHTVWHRLHPAELHARLKEGASLALDSVDELHPPIARLCEAIERELRTRVQANLYASWSATEGFGVHWDDHDTVIVQLEGAKRWRIYGTTRLFPLYRDIEDPGEAPTEPVADLVLWPGDVLYVPRGVWHAVSADQGTRSLHVTCGLQTHTATDLMAWVSEQLLTHEDWRRDLPLLAAPDVQADAVDGMRKRLAELLDDPTLLARYRVAMDGQAVGRMVPSLPYIDTVPVDGALRVRLTTARAVLDVGEDTVMLSAAGSTFEFAPAAEAVLRPLVDGRTVDLAGLAETAGLALEDVVGLVQELVAGQAATVGSLL